MTARVAALPTEYPGAECVRVFETCASFAAPGLSMILVLIPLRRLPETIAAGQRGTLRVEALDAGCSVFGWEAE